MAIIGLQIGSCGNKVGTKFWEEISQEHGISARGERQEKSDVYFEKIGVYYNETANRYTPRNILVDLDPTLLDSIYSSEYGQHFNPQNFVSGHGGTAGNWGVGHYRYEEEVLASAMEAVRREVEASDRLQGFQITHSLGGGTGSGFGTKLMYDIKEEYCDRAVSSYSVFPSDKVNSAEVYNSVLAVQLLVDSADLVNLIDNEAVFNLSQRSNPVPQLGDLNEIIGQAMNGLTAPLRYASNLNSTLQSTLTALVPFYRLHFLTPSFVSTQAQGASVVSKLTSKVFDSSNSLVSTPFKTDCTECIFAATATFRGEVNSSEAYEQSLRAAQSNYNFTTWISDPLKTEVLPVPQRGFNSSVAVLSNTAGVSNFFTKLSESFKSMFERKAHVHLYTEVGMDEMEFIEAESNLDDLISELTTYSTSMDDE
jgi:tubulin beta